MHYKINFWLLRSLQRKVISSVYKLDWKLPDKVTMSFMKIKNELLNIICEPIRGSVADYRIMSHVRQVTTK